MNLIIINMFTTKTNQEKNAYIIIIFVFVKVTWISNIHIRKHRLSHDKNQYSNEDAYYHSSLYEKMQIRYELLYITIWSNIQMLKVVMNRNVVDMIIYI